MTRSRLPLTCLPRIAGALLLLAASRLPAAGPDGDPFEPAVTQAESRLLARVMDAAATNTAAAIRLLEAQDREQAGPALDFALGNLYFREDRLDAAAAAYEAALAKLPRFRGALANLGRVYLLRRETARAVALFQDLVADGQADAESLLLLGHALLAEDLPVSAETAYRQALLLAPRRRNARLGLCRALVRQTRYAEAAALARELLAARPADGELWALRAAALLALEEPEAAARALEQARRLDCADAEMLATLGDLCLNAGRPADALAAYRDAFAEAATPALPRILRAAEGFLAAGDTNGAARLLDRADAVHDDAAPPDPALDRTRLRLRAELARRAGRPDDAARLCRRLLDTDPLNGPALLLLGDLQHEAGRAEAALLTYERAARVAGFEAEALIRQARLEVARGRIRRAVSLLEAARGFSNAPALDTYLEQLRRMIR